MNSARTVALYMRVSTGEQDVELQRRELRAACERHGWDVVAEYVDHGISGAKGREQRPEFDRLCAPRPGAGGRNCTRSA
jgi:DNA invertase Pin-like site-specific DNA recombinase